MTLTDPEMTRFLMSLEESVDLVIKAFSDGRNGDIFVQKAPAATVGDVVLALKEIFNSKSEIKVIGTRHGEKKHETLVSREEKQRAVETATHYQVPLDSRNLNYSAYFLDGTKLVSQTEDYTSQNTKRLSVSELKELFLKLPFISESLST